MSENGTISLEETKGWEVGTAEAILRECLNTFLHHHIRVTGTCMTPELHPGDSVSVASAARRPPRWGDIVSVRSRDSLRLHRLVWRWPFASGRLPWLTKADRNLNGVAAFIWEQFDGRRDGHRIVAEIAERFDVDHSRTEGVSS